MDSVLAFFRCSFTLTSRRTRHVALACALLVVPCSVVDALLPPDGPGVPEGRAGMGRGGTSRGRQRKFGPRRPDFHESAGVPPARRRICPCRLGGKGGVLMCKGCRELNARAAPGTISASIVPHRHPRTRGVERSPVADAPLPVIPVPTSGHACLQLTCAPPRNLLLCRCGPPARAERNARVESTGMPMLPPLLQQQPLKTEPWHAVASARTQSGSVHSTCSLASNAAVVGWEGQQRSSARRRGGGGLVFPPLTQSPELSRGSRRTSSPPPRASCGRAW